jgi:lipoprotein-anchoring transpeptidase ErfK/SrfK
MKKITIGVIAGVVVLAIILTVAFLPKKKEVIEMGSSSVSLKDAENALQRGALIEARNLYKEAMDKIEDVNALDKIQAKIEKINTDIIFSPAVDECSTIYEVQPKDALVKIAKQFNTTIELIKRSNNLTSDTIRPGQKLKINTCKFSIVVDKSQNNLFLKRGDEVIKVYTISTGKDNSTPIGTFFIDGNKLIDPTWYKAGAVIPPDSPENILGSRWMGLVSIEYPEIKGYGIHGTTLPEELGQQITLGCVRMKNEEVEELFDIVPVGTEVVIID